MLSHLSLEQTKEGTKLTLLLPTRFTLPARLGKLTAEEWAHAIVTLDRILASQEKIGSDEQIQTLVEQHEKDIQKLESQHKRELQRLETRADEKEKSFSKQIHELQLQLDKASQSHDILRDQFLDEANRRVKESVQLQKENDLKHTNYLESEVERLRAENKELEAKHQTRLSIQNNSSRKGREGEQLFEDIVLQRKGWSVVRVANTGHSADYRAMLHSIQVRFEVKNYTHTIPSHEVEKLQNDLREHPETDVGVLISLNTNIALRSAITIEWTPTNQAILFIPCFLQQDIDIILHFLEIIFQTIKPFRANLRMTSQGAHYAKLQERVELSVVYAKNSLIRKSEQLGRFSMHMKALKERLELMNSDICGDFAGLEQDLQSLLALLSGQEKQTDPIEGKHEELPKMHAEKKRPNRRKPAASSV